MSSGDAAAVELSAAKVSVTAEDELMPLCHN